MAPAAVVRRADTGLPPPAHAGLLGINGLTAYLAPTALGRPEAGDTVLVSTAAGAVDSLVGQIGRNPGCRMIGVTGGGDKAGRCRARYGSAAAFSYRAEGWAAAADREAPGGLAVYFDSVGGAILDAAPRRMAVGRRVVQCGTASTASWTPPPQGPRVERKVLARRLVWSGFVVFDHARSFDAAVATLVGWTEQGRIACGEDVAEGIEQAPGAIASLYAGEDRGKKLIYVG